MTFDALRLLLEQAHTHNANGRANEAETLARQVLDQMSINRVTDELQQRDDIRQRSECDMRAAATMILGDVAVLQQNVPAALELYRSSLSMSEAVGEKNAIAQALLKIAKAQQQGAEKASAIESYTRALLLYEELGDTVMQAQTLNHIGVVHRMMSDFSQALTVHEKARLLVDNVPENTTENAAVSDTLAQSLNDLGSVYMELADYSRAREFFVSALALFELSGNRERQAGCLSNIGVIYDCQSDYASALEYLQRSLSLQAEQGHNKTRANTLGNIGLVYSNLSDFKKALEYYNQALSMSRDLGIRQGVATWLCNIGVVYDLMSDFQTALQYYAQALRVDEELGNKTGVASILCNIGLAYQNMGDLQKARGTFDQALELSLELGSKNIVAMIRGNIGSTCVKQQRYQEAIDYYQKSMKLFREMGVRLEESNLMSSIGAVYATTQWSGYDEIKAEEYLLAAVALSEELGIKNIDAHKTLSELYKDQKLWEKSRTHYEKFHILKEEILNEEVRKSAAQMEQQRQIAEHEKEIAIAKAAANAQLLATTTLLHKVLPESIATRMIGGESEIADFFPSVSILFADIAGFTPISADMSPSIVVRFLNYVFREFDRIMKKHGCEKIKTIGDGYMAVVGAPIACEDHAERIATAALEMQRAIVLPAEIQQHLPPGSSFGLRIGLHTGSVMAGVIGDERFVYDIYSDAVNTAARMESHGQPNKIHVSSEFIQHLQKRFTSTDNVSHGMVFEQRGELEIKGKGKMNTYFLERA